MLGAAEPQATDELDEPNPPPQWEVDLPSDKSEKASSDSSTTGWVTSFGGDVDC